MNWPFWDFSLRVYAAAGVADECLTLQDRCGIDVNLLLFCAYLGASGALITRDDVQHVSVLVKPWHEDVVKPLRTARHALKIWRAPDSMPSGQPAEALRGKVKEVELESERIEQAMLDQWALQRSGQFTIVDAKHAIEANIRLLIECFGAGAQSASQPRALVGATLAAANTV